VIERVDGACRLAVVADHSAGRGRPRAAVASEVAAIGLRLFARNGYAGTTMEEIATAAGISRPTLFRYFPAKRDIVWDRYEDEATELRSALANSPTAAEPLDVLCEILPRLLHYTDAELDLLRAQVTLISTVPDVQGHAQEKLSGWADIIAEYISVRLEVPQDSLLPRVMSQCVWSAGWTALTVWAVSDETRPDDALARAFEALRAGFQLGSLRRLSN
jgi:AcrR family transcriptional regulator